VVFLMADARDHLGPRGPGSDSSFATQTIPVGQQRAGQTGLSYDLTSQGESATAFGKAILLGEHSVVYGKSAIAVALPGLALRLSILPRQPGSQLASWDDAWNVSSADARRKIDAQTRSLLSQCLDRALRESTIGRSLADFTPQPLRVESNFPMGAGLGGSAALCVATVRLVDAIARQRIPGQLLQSHRELELQRAARLDAIFHGVASGIDTATVLSEGLIEAAGNGTERRFNEISNGRSFFIALVDSGSRSDTAAMVEKVRLLRNAQPIYVDDKIARLGEISHAARFEIAEGRLEALGHRLNEAHEHLRDLGLSTPSLDRIVNELRELGALGAKLTGSGGGGFALGLFREYPEWVESYLPAKGAIYVSQVSQLPPEEIQRRYSPGEVRTRQFD
jgi:mevalonate kinase